MRFRVLSSLWVGVLVALVAAGCLDGAPRSNPLDPRGENFENEGAIVGQATEVYPPFAGLRGVEIRVEPGPLFAVSNAEGAFRLEGLVEGEYVVTASLDGYAAVRDTCRVVAGQEVAMALRLGGLPTVEAFELQTTHLSRWWPPPQELFRIEVMAAVADPDGVSDIDRVWVEVPALGFADTLAAGATPGAYVRMLQEENLPTRIEGMLGHAHQIHVRDRLGNITTSRPGQIARLIEETPVALTPTSLTALNEPTPRFVWERIRLTFPYTYRLDVVRVDENIQNIVQTVEGIHADTLSLVAPSALAPGEYFWTISVVDEFGNRSRSREAGFRIL